MFGKVVLWVEREILKDSMARDVFYDSFLSDQVGSVGKLLSCCNKSFKNYFSEPKVNNKWELPNGQNLALKWRFRGGGGGGGSCPYVYLRKWQRKGDTVKDSIQEMENQVLK